MSEVKFYVTILLVIVFFGFLGQITGYALRKTDNYFNEKTTQKVAESTVVSDEEIEATITGIIKASSRGDLSSLKLSVSEDTFTEDSKVLLTLSKLSSESINIYQTSVDTKDDNSYSISVVCGDDTSKYIVNCDAHFTRYSNISNDVKLYYSNFNVQEI